MKARIIVTGAIYHRGNDEKVVSVESQYSVPTSSEETAKPIIHHLKVGQEWVPIDFQGMDAPGMLMICNTTVGNWQVYPTPEETEDVSRRVVMLADMSYPDDKAVTDHKRQPVWLIAPGTDMRGVPSMSMTHDLALRCQHKEADVTVVIFPR